MPSLVLHLRHVSAAHGWLIPSFVLGLGLLAMGLFFVSPLLMLALTIGVVAVVGAFIWPWETLVAILFFLPFEQFFLSFLPDSIYVPARFLSEGLLYIVFIRTAFDYLLRGNRTQASPLDLPMASIFVVALLSVLLNLVPPEIGFLGIRNIFRFLLIAWLIVRLRPQRSAIQKIIFGIIILGIIQSIIGIAQALIGYSADQLLQTTDREFLGGITNVVQSWDPGRRVSATLGRYDRFGTWLSFILLLVVGLLYELREQKRKVWLWLALIVGLPALALTQSRASWFGFVVGLFIMAVFIRRDRRVMWGLGLVVVVVLLYLVYSGLVVHTLLDPANATVAERFFEAFSWTRWRAEYYGTGRLYFIVQTPIRILTHAPLFGVGPGRYGGGVAAALHVTSAYDELGLPFGSGGESGFIDNSWLSLFGELGLLGILAYGWLMVTAFTIARYLIKQGASAFDRGFGLGLFGLLCATLIEAFLATHLEVRTFAAYLWFFVGIGAWLWYQQHYESKQT